MDGESSGRCDLETILQDPNAQPCDIPLHYLRDITDDFKEEIGHGGFGVVYKGVLPNGGMIAVKNLVIMQGIQEKHFQNEVNNLMRVRHQNIIRFVGYCYEARKKHMEYEGKYIFAERPKLLLCFEYMPKGSLDKYISDAPCRFGWLKCYKIIEGICHGLNYLHKECQTDASIVHLDLKPANILLDENMVPKIADFGLSRFFADKKTRTLASTPAGSLGYMAPEYLFRRIITTKADIYSLGVIIIEMITGQTFSPLDIVAVEPALEYWRARLDAEPMHTSVEICCKQIKNCLDIGLSCVNSDHLERPTAREIIKRLKSLESIKCDVSDVERPAADKFISDHKELIEVTPTELQFFLALEQRIPCFLKLTNKTNESVAFCFPAVGPRHKLYVEPASGVIWPGSVSMVCVTMHEQQELPLDQKYKDQLLVQSIIVRKYIVTSKAVVEDMFKNISSNLVHEVELTVVYVASPTSALDSNNDQPVSAGDEAGKMTPVSAEAPVGRAMAAGRPAASSNPNPRGGFKSWLSRCGKLLRVPREKVFNNAINLSSIPGVAKEFDYKTLRKGTNNFDEKMKLGQGGYGVVYWATVLSDNGESMEVAIKRFSRDNTKGQEDFLAELSIINRLRHRNLVKLIGWCHQNGVLLLVYEYMPNGSLDRHLFGGKDVPTLDWTLRHNVLTGVATALNYLHAEFEQTVIHRDIKPSNVMLDSGFNARLGDFGLARAIESDRSSYTDHIGVPGTMGYIAPECFHTGRATRESDVFALGAVILEVVCGRRIWCSNPAGSSQLVEWVWKLHGAGRVLEAVDPRLADGGLYDKEKAERLLLLGLACSHPNPRERPGAHAILQTLVHSVSPPFVPLAKPVFIWPTLPADSEEYDLYTEYDSDESLALSSGATAI